METEDCPDQNEGFQHNYDDEQDSDVEARLYAEIYYSNTIIGEENNINNSTSNNQSQIVLDCNGDSLLDTDKNQQTSNINVTGEKATAVSNKSNNVITTTKNTAKDPNTQNRSSFTKESASTQRMSNSNNIVKSKKRISNDLLDEANKSNKKKKRDNQISLRESKSSQSNTLLNISELNQQKDHIVLHNDNTLINPYNKNVNERKQTGIKLLSPEFINLFFGSKSKNKKSKNELALSNKNKTSNVCNIPPNSNIILQPSKAKPIENSIEKDFVTESAVIEVSSDSSRDSFEDDSKYNTILATDKKVKKRESGLKNTAVNDSPSDSEESIFEVPIPPKPTPPIIEVRDSDNEHDNHSKSNESSFENNSFISEESMIQNNHEISLNFMMDDTDDTCEIISDNDSSNDDSNNLILNCTEVQKGVSNLSEIKRMNQQTLNASKENPSCSNLSNIQHSQNKSKLSNNSGINGKSFSSSKRKVKSKSPTKNISVEEYLFQPMTDKMKSFYNDSWGGENFDMNEIKSNMSNDPNKWIILNKDLVLSGPKRKRYFGMTCAKCHKDGHRQNDCPEPNKGPTCYMCGDRGHFVTNCPHTKCLTCGKKQTSYRPTCRNCERLFCRKCRSQGHREDSCPDLWRRYHDTTNSPAPKIPRHINNVMKHRHQLFCCNCTKQGHDSQYCRKLRWSQHFPNPSFVTHYNGPIYNNITNVHLSKTVNNLQDSSHVKNIHNTTLNRDHLSSNSITSYKPSTSFPRSDKNCESTVQNIVSHSPSVSEKSKNFIFNVCQMDDKFYDEILSMKSATLKLYVPNVNTSTSVESWKKLSEFLNVLVAKMPGEFCLEQKDKQLLMYVKSSRKYSESLYSLIKQYASRSNFERSQMLLSDERTLKIIVDHLSRKFAEMRNLNEDILTLYKETRRLREELPDEENKTGIEVCIRLKLNDLTLSQQKLLMLLYREGFGDESLGQLRKLFLKMEKSIEQTSAKAKLKKSKLKHVPLISFKCLFTYLYYYNNIFVPYESRKLENFIQKYKDNLDKRNKLLNNPLLFSRELNEIQNDQHKMTNQDNTSKVQTLSEDQESKSLPSTSHELPISQNNVIKEASTNSMNDNSNSSDIQQTSESSKQMFKKNPNHMYLLAIKAKNVKSKENLMQNFKNFIKNARNCLAKARKLNSPRLKNDIVNLQRDLEDEIYLNVSKVRKFRKKLQAETLRLKSVKKNPKKKLKVGPDSNDIYKKFCASL